VRHGGPIPHDDDCDFGMHYKDFKKLPRLLKLFEAKGYLTKVEPKVIKIWCNQLWTRNEYRDFGTPTLDIFPYTIHDGAVKLKFEAKRWPNAKHLTKDFGQLIE